MDGNLTPAMNFYKFICEIYTQVLVHIRLISVLIWEHIAMEVFLFLVTLSISGITRCGD